MDKTLIDKATAPSKKVLEFFKQNRLDPAAFMESRRKDVEALASLNVTVLAGLQTLVRQQAEFVCETALNLQSLGKGKPVDGQSVARVAELLPQSLYKAVDGLREMTDTVYKVQAESVATVGKRLAENVEEAKGLLRPRQ